MKISDVAKLTGVTVRTLHYYGKIMQNPAYDKENALQKQKELLLQKRNRLDGLISLVDKILKGEQDMSFEQFDTTKIEETKKKYAAEAQSLVKKWQDYITAHYYTCTKEILRGLGQMYVGDERFTQHIDQYGDGTAAFMAAAIVVYTR